jgi:hypothetical protein
MKCVFRITGYGVGAFAPFALLACGCSGAGWKVTGSVTRDGQPLSGAQVVFLRVGERFATGERVITGSDGNFELKARPGGKEALPPGQYNVLITRLVDKKGNVPKEEDYGQLEAAGRLKNELPEKYGDKDFPQFTVEIKAGDNNLPPFDVNVKKK